MKRLLNRLPKWLRRQPALPATDIAIPGEPKPWETKDTLTLRAFLDGETGRKLSGALRSLTVREAFVAVSNLKSEKSLDWQCGHASGVRSVVEVIDAWAEVKSDKPEPKDDRPTDDLNWLNGNTDNDDRTA